MPPTGSTSACCHPKATRIVLAAHAGADRRLDTALRQRRGTARGRCRLPIPRILGHDNELGILALQDLGDVTLQAHLGSEPFSTHAALYRQAVSLIATLQRRGAELASPIATCRTASPSTSRSCTWELDFFLKNFVEGYRGAAAERGRAGGDPGRVQAHRRRAGGRAARALPSRLPQPQPDAAPWAGCT